jgi:O-antigen/teichoic acid export membrane protein
MSLKENKQEIKKQAFWGIMWRGGYQTFHHLSSMLVKLILIRLLLPADFGLVAMAMVVFSSLDIINRFSRGEPFIRDNIFDPRKAKNTLFYLSFIFLGGTAVIGFFSAPYAALFFSKKIPSQESVTTLMWIIRVFSLRLLLSVFASVPVATLTKELRFKELYIGNIAGTAAYVITAPILAFLGFGVWAIVIAHIIEQVAITIIFLIFSPFFPAWIFDKRIAKNYIWYNSNIFINAIIMIVISEGDDTIIGRLMGPAILGFYNIGQQFAMLATSIISSNVTDIVFPVFSRVQKDKDMFKQTFIKAFRLINLSAIPLIGGSIVLAKEIVLCLFGERWLPMVPVFYILSIATLFSVIISIAGSALQSLNKPHIIRNGYLLCLLAFLILIYPFAELWGHLGVCWVMVILSVISILYLTPKLANEIPDFYSNVFVILSRIIICTIIMMISVYLFKKLIPVSLIWLLGAALVGILVYASLMLLSDKVFKSDIHEALTILKEKLTHSPL